MGGGQTLRTTIARDYDRVESFEIPEVCWCAFDQYIRLACPGPTLIDEPTARTLI